MNKVLTMSNGTRYAIFDEIYAGDRRFAIAFRVEGVNPTNEYVICEVKLAKDGTMYLVDIRDLDTYKNVSTTFIRRLTKE